MARAVSRKASFDDVCLLDTPPPFVTMQFLPSVPPWVLSFARTHMKCRALLGLSLVTGVLAGLPLYGQPGKEKPKLYLEPINVNIPHISTDKTVKFDYNIVYVRALRSGDKIHKRYYTDFSSPVTIEPGADLM